MNIGIEENIIKKLQNIFSEYSEIEEVILYGSRAKGNYNHGSDIDIVLLGEKLNLTLLNKIDILIDDLLLPYSFDISIINQLDNPDLIDHVNRRGISIYKKNNDRL
jgi:uncharacterized protein